MSGRLPQQIDPIRLADEGAVLVGTLPGDVFARLREISRSGAVAPVEIDLRFERTIHGEHRMFGAVRTKIAATCQRCLGPMEIAVESSLNFLLQQAASLPANPQDAGDGNEDSDTLVVNGPVELPDLVEDELLLAMPMIPVHDEQECSAPGKRDLPDAASGKRNPFEALRDVTGKSSGRR
jgi:uncharacterized protein